MNDEAEINLIARAVYRALRQEMLKQVRNSFADLRADLRKDVQWAVARALFRRSDDGEEWKFGKQQDE
jgi:hypothetical protein